MELISFQPLARLFATPPVTWIFHMKKDRLNGFIYESLDTEPHSSSASNLSSIDCRIHLMSMNKISIGKCVFHVEISRKREKLNERTEFVEFILLLHLIGGFVFHWFRILIKHQHTPVAATSRELEAIKINVSHTFRNWSSFPGGAKELMKQNTTHDGIVREAENFPSVSAPALSGE